jgi:hypothetical protein
MRGNSHGLRTGADEIMPHQHKCTHCKKTYDCKQNHATVEDSRNCKRGRKGICPKCFDKIVNGPIDMQFFKSKFYALPGQNTPRRSKLKDLGDATL